MPSSLANKTPAPGREFTARLEKLLQMPNALKRRRSVADIADGLGLAEVREGLRRLDTLHIAERDPLLVALMGRWGELDPEAALAYASHLWADPGLQEIGAVAKSWATKDPAAAFAAIARLSASAKEAAMSGAIEALSESDPRQAFELARQNALFSPTAEVLFGNWAESDPEEAIAYASKLPAGYQRQEALGAAARVWAEKNLESALAWVQTRSEDETPGVYGPDSPTGAILACWMRGDPEKAMQWVNDLPEGRKRSGVLNSLINGRVSDDLTPTMAVRLASMFSPGQRRDEAWNHVMVWWGTADLPGALAWAKEQPSDIQRATLPQLAVFLAFTEPEGALKLALGAGGGTEDMVDEILSRWTDKNPNAAAAWAQKQSDKPEYLTKITADWLQTNPTGATEWVNSLASGASKDQLLMSVVEKLEVTQHRVAAEWIAGISDSQKRDAAYKALAERWLQTDRNGALEWLKAAPLEEDVKAALLRKDSR